MIQLENPCLGALEVLFIWVAIFIIPNILRIGQSLKEFHIGLGFGQSLQNGLGGHCLIHTSPLWGSGDHLQVHAPHEPDALQHIGAEQQLFAAGGRFFDVDGGENAALLQAAGEVHFHDAGAFELFKDDGIQG